MRIIRLDKINGKSIKQYDSNMIMRKILMTEKPSHVGIIHLDKGGIVGYHDASMPQVLVIIEGNGWVRAGKNSKVSVAEGDVIMWEKGEGHETISDSGLKAIVIESEGLDINALYSN